MASRRNSPPAQTKATTKVKSDNESFFGASEEYQISVLTEVEDDLKKAKSKDDVAKVFSKWYATVGLKSIGRLLIGRSPAQAVPGRKKDEKKDK